MTKYLVDCNCGNKLPVEIGQAGGRITCSCGNRVDVPPLRKLRHLPLAAAERHRAASIWDTWNARKGVITASLILVGALAVINGWSWFTQPAVPKFDPAGYQREVVERRLKTMTPSESWLWWIEYYRPLAERGFGVLELSNRQLIERNIAQRESMRRTLWIVAGISAAVAAMAAAWPKSSEVTSRRVD